MSKENHIVIDPEVRSFIPQSSDEELAQLEANIVADKQCIDPLVTWRGILIDGHSRKRICDKLGIGYRVINVDHLPDRESAILWAVNHQAGRRNWSDFQRAQVFLKLKPIIEAKARQRELAGKRATSSPVASASHAPIERGSAPDAGHGHMDKDDPSQNSDEGMSNSEVTDDSGLPKSSEVDIYESGRTDESIAEKAGISRDGVRKVESVLSSGDPALIDMATRGDVSISAAAEVAKLPAAEQARVAADGPAAVKARAAAARKGKPKAAAKEEAAAPNPDDPNAPPWAGFEAQVRAVMGELEAIADKLRNVLQGKAAGNVVRNPWGQFISFMGSVGAIRAVAKHLEDNLPAAASDKPPGYKPRRDVEQHEKAVEARG
jgi:ParB-like chromosome segregation protein Spo0J